MVRNGESQERLHSAEVCGLSRSLLGTAPDEDTEHLIRALLWEGPRISPE